MSVLKIEPNNKYTVDALYQWDLNQTLTIFGLSLESVPEIHFTNSNMGKAIVRQSTMDSTGVITVKIPNSLLQVATPILVYICTYDNGEFNSRYSISIPVKSRKKPEDYSFTDDEEIYSFNELENMVYNAVYTLDARYEDFTNTTDKKYSDFINEVNNSIETANTSAKNAEESAKQAEQASADAVTEALEKAILKSDIVEIVKVTELPENPSDNVLYVIV